ncbi:MAG: copper amine oxidase N-terminal domain-containing protein [Tissierellia bacterium]|nr:copper amine oxidase N-terminal domain-containing protein [Tissierellia bacterium]
MNKKSFKTFISLALIVVLLLPLVVLADTQVVFGQAVNEEFMTGTWSFESDGQHERRGDMKAFIQQSGNSFYGTYNKNHYDEWQMGTIEGTIDGDIVKCVMRFNSWKVADGSEYESGTWNFSFRWNEGSKSLTGDPFHVQMKKVSNQVGTPDFNSIVDVMRGSNTIVPTNNVVTADFSGTWTYDSAKMGEEYEEETSVSQFSQTGDIVKGRDILTDKNGQIEEYEIEGKVIDGIFYGMIVTNNNKLELHLDKNDPNKLIWYRGVDEVEYDMPFYMYRVIGNSNINQDAKALINEVEQKIKPAKPVPAPTPAKPAPTTDPTIIKITGGEAAETTIAATVSSGVSVSISQTGALGYRLYRSENSGQLGISVSDFYFTSTSFADVNVEPNKTYYYTLKEVLAEAKPLEGVDEKIGRTLATWVVTTRSDINTGFTGGKTKQYIILKVKDPNMSVKGIKQEVDPGRGTTPIILRNRTLVPISSVVKAMGGGATWTGGTREVGLTANGNKVQMWIDKKEMKVNGADSKMDVAPIIENDRTFVPIRFATENLKCKVDWLNSTKEIFIVWEE